MPITVYKSDKPEKRFMAEYHGLHNIVRYFGQPNGFTYIDGNTTQARANYWKRHTQNPLERDHIDNPYTPSCLSLNILWGPYRDINKNIEEFNKKYFNRHAFS